jgi:hypothetical protein
MQREFDFDTQIRSVDLLYQPDWFQQQIIAPVDSGKWFYVGFGNRICRPD